MKRFECGVDEEDAAPLNFVSNNCKWASIRDTVRFQIQGEAVRSRDNIQCDVIADYLLNIIRLFKIITINLASLWELNNRSSSVLSFTSFWSNIIPM